jgi:hypothetical protein
MGSGEFQRMRHPAMWAEGNHGVLLARDVVATSANRLVHSLSAVHSLPEYDSAASRWSILTPFWCSTDLCCYKCVALL